MLVQNAIDGFYDKGSPVEGRYDHADEGSQRAFWSEIHIFSIGKLSERRIQSVCKGWRCRVFVFAVTARSFTETNYFYDVRGGAGGNDAHQTGEQPVNQEPVAFDILGAKKVLHNDSFRSCSIFLADALVMPG